MSGTLEEESDDNVECYNISHSQNSMECGKTCGGAIEVVPKVMYE